ncbi:LysR substrate-binding domain-containing protein [Bordetella trematum]|uniref:LysR substrate-binding domain-containing protein n=1 Tax=Bordetella trematum TaxID=123899 RepID=UPI0015C558AA|nr:LysR substrate-binding domain-containing protein [Bordetella trematum]
MPIPLAKLPPLDLIRGFVAVARRMSITQAAHDLHLTQSAVSRQIRALETHLGVALFTRGFRSIALTPEGAQLFRLADPWLTQLGELGERWRHPGRRQPVTVSTTIGVAALWLLPRLGAFQQAHPGIDVRVAADNRVLPLGQDGVDIAIRYCRGRPAGEPTQWLFGEAVVPVAHPSLAEAPLDVASLPRQVLLEFDDPSRPWLQWDEWLGSHGMQALRPRGMLRFNQYDQVVQAALAGQGVALGRLALVAPMLADGRLRALGSAAPEQTPLSYWLVRQPRDGSPDTEIVAQWLLEQAQAGQP